MGTPKRERQKLNRSTKLEELAKANQTAKRKSQVIRYVSIAAVAAVAIIGYAVLTKNKDKTVSTASPVTTVEGSGSTVAGGSTSVPVITTAATITPAPAGKSITGDTPCPKADGSEERVSTFAKAPPMCIDAAKTYTATIETNKGTYKALLDTKNAPKTVNNFVVLARYHYYDATPCHRILKGFMAQCGDPTGQGNGSPGYTIPDELPKASSDYKPGTLAMANTSKPNTGGSQFFTMFRDGLAPQYSIFGQVTEGLDTTIKALEAVGNPSPTGVAPTEPVSITKVTITES